MPLNAFLIHRLSLTLPASGLNEGLYLVHRSQIPSVFANYIVAYAIDLLVVHQGPLSFLFLYFGLLGLDIILYLVSYTIVGILLELEKDIRCVGFKIIELPQNLLLLHSCIVSLQMSCRSMAH